MVFDNDVLVKREKITNVSEICWKELCDADRNELRRKFLKVHLSRGADITVIFSYVRENVNNFEAQGKFYDDGNFYLMRIWYFWDHDYASVEFVPWPASSILESEHEYIEYVKHQKPES
ncbi:MAG: hypothetical protein K5871_03425 [Lachnospiraceae bacterium]|nr:hypothetical protein [Lachnospiraceae bacterium]